MKTLQKFAWMCAAVLGILSLVFFMFLPMLKIEQPLGTQTKTGLDLAFGEDGHWLFVVALVLLALGVLGTLVLGVMKKKKLLLVTALLLLVAGVLMFLVKTMAVADAVNKVKDLGQTVMDLTREGAKDSISIGVGAILSGILAILGAGASAFGALEK